MKENDTELINTLSKKGEVYEIYHTSNPFILWLAKRFLSRVENLLIKINAKELKGIDIGSGEGHMLNKLKNEDIIDDIIGIDLDEERIAYAKHHFGQIEFTIGDIYNLPDFKTMYDYVIATEILEHLPKPELALEKLRDITADNGYIIVSVPHEPFFQLGNVLRGKHWHRRGKTPAHLNFWNKREFEKLLKRNNIQIVQHYSAKTFPWLLYLGRFV